MAPKSSAAGDAGLVGRPSLTFKRRLNAPPAKVYAAWTDPQRIIHWFGRADARRESFQADIDPKVGGRFREVVPNRRLLFSWAWHSTPERESQVTVSLQPDGAGTLMTVHHEQLFDTAARDGHERGWIASLDQLEKSLA